MTITYKQLIDKKACKEQRKLFKKTFGQLVTLTQDIVKKYVSQFDDNWLAENFLNEKDYKEYEEKFEPFYKEYKEKRELFWKEYVEKCDSSWKEYKEKCEQFWREYKEKRSIVFFEIVNNNKEYN